MDELGAQFDWNRRPWIAMRPDASADALARLEHDEADALLMQIARGGNAGSAGANDRNVELRHAQVDARDVPWGGGLAGPLRGARPTITAPALRGVIQS